MDWFRLSSTIELNRIQNFVWVRFPNQSSLIEQIEPNHIVFDWVQFPNLVEHNRLPLVNLNKASPKQSHQSRFFLCFFTIYPVTETPFINCPRQLRKQNRTKLSLFPRAYSEIVVPFSSYNCSKTTGRVIPGSLLLNTWSLQSTAHLKPLLRNFFVYEKHVRCTRGSSNSSFQDLVMDFQRLFYTNHEFENRTFVWVRLIFLLFREFDFVWLPNSIELNPWIEFDGVRLGSIYYVGKTLDQNKS